MFSRRFFLTALKGLTLFFVIAFPLAQPTAATGLEDKAKTFIHSLAGEAIESLTRLDAPRDIRVQKFRALFKKHFAVRTIGRFVLGRYWRAAGKEEREEYLKLFEDLMVVSYVDRFNRYTGNNLNVVKAHAEKANSVTVFTQLPRGDAKPVNVLWRIGSRGENMKILDVIIEGVSMSQTLRSDFSSIIRQKDGKVSGLLEELRRKTAALKAGDKVENNKK